MQPQLHFTLGVLDPQTCYKTATNTLLIIHTRYMLQIRSGNARTRCVVGFDAGCHPAHTRCSQTICCTPFPPTHARCNQTHRVCNVLTFRQCCVYCGCFRSVFFICSERVATHVCFGVGFIICLCACGFRDPMVRIHGVETIVFTMVWETPVAKPLYM